MVYGLVASVFGVGLLFGMSILLEVGRRIVARRLAEDLKGAEAGVGTVNWVHMLGLAFVMAVSVYVILDIEYPRLGFIRVDAFDQALIDLRDGMK